MHRAAPGKGSRRGGEASAASFLLCSRAFDLSCPHKAPGKGVGQAMRCCTRALAVHVNKGLNWLYMFTRGSIGCTCLQGARLAVHVFKGLNWLYMFTRGSIGCTCLQGAQLAVHVYKGLNWLYMFTRGSIGCTCSCTWKGSRPGKEGAAVLQSCSGRALAVHWPCIGRVQCSNSLSCVSKDDTVCALQWPSPASCCCCCYCCYCYGCIGTAVIAPQVALPSHTC
jgi:hypothetical protein